MYKYSDGESEEYAQREGAALAEAGGVDHGGVSWRALSATRWANLRPPLGAKCVRSALSSLAKFALIL